MTLRDEMQRARPAIDGINAAIRDNPLAAGLIGAGLAWMLLGGSKGISGIASIGAQGVRAGGSAVGGAARNVADAATRVAGGLPSMDDVAGSVASIVPSSSVVDPLSDAVAGASQAVGNQWDSLTSATRTYGAALQSRLSDGLERQPLLLGVIGLGIGAGLAASFATTATESNWMGEQGAEVRSRIQGVATEVKHRAGEVVSAIKNEAEAQGLTPADAREAASTVSDKARSVADAARDSLKEGVTRR